MSDYLRAIYGLLGVLGLIACAVYAIEVIPYGLGATFLLIAIEAICVCLVLLAMFGK